MEEEKVDMESMVSGIPSARGMAEGFRHHGEGRGDESASRAGPALNPRVFQRKARKFQRPVAERSGFGLSALF